MALVAILTGIVNLFMLMPWMATRAIPTSLSCVIKSKVALLLFWCFP